MKLLISASASPTWAKGQRVLVKIDRNEWYAATVKSVRVTGVQCTADDGDPIKFDNDATARDVKLLEAGLPVRKRALSDLQVKDLVSKDKDAVKKLKEKAKLVADKAKAAAKRTTQVKPQPRVPRIKPPVTSPVRVVEPEAHKPKTPVVHVAPTSRNPRPAYNVTYSSSSRALLDYLNKLWAWANDEYFEGRLPKPAAIRMQRDVGPSSMRRRAAWFPSKRVISVHPRLFNAPEDKVHEIFVHEMCHQAVTDIDRVNDNSNGGHGPNWASWMVRCGLSPTRFDTHGNSHYMDEAEKEAHQQRQERKAEDTHKIKQTTQRPFVWNGQMAAVCYTDGNGIVYGLAACPSDKKEGRIAVVINPHKGNFMKIPTSWLFVVPEDDVNYIRVTGPSFREMAEKVQNHFAYKDRARDMRRAMRSFFG